MTTTSEAVPTEALHSGNFVALWIAQVVSRFGDPITLIALAYVSYVATRSAFFTAMAVVIATVPNAAFGVFGGAIADAFGHRRTMIVCDFARVVLVGLVPLSIMAGLPLATAYALVFGVALCGSIFNPARLALLPRVVSPKRIASANALVYSSDRAVEVLGALAGGVLVATIGERAFYVDALTFLVSGLVLLRIRLSESRSTLSARSLVNEAFDGLRFIGRNVVLRANTILSIIGQLSTPVVTTLTPVLVFQKFSGGNPELGAAEFGAAEAAIAVGAVAGAAYLPRTLAKHEKGRVILAGFALYGAVLVGLSVVPIFELALLLFGLAGFMNVVFYVANITLAQELTPPELRARVFGSRIALLNLTWLPVIVISGALADVLTVPFLIGAAGLLSLCTAIGGALIPAVRDVP